MIITILLIFTFTLLFFSPHDLWQDFDRYLTRVVNILKKGEITRAKTFFRYLDQVILMYRLGRETQRESIPKYYPYSDTLEKIVTLKASYGFNISSQLQLLKEDMHDQIQFLEQKKSIIGAAHVQFILMSGIIASFQILSSKILNMELNLLVMLCCFIIELVGFLIFHFLAQKKVGIIFKDVYALHAFFCQTESLVQSHLPANKVIQELSSLSPDLKGIKELELKEQLFFLLRNWQQSGIAIRDELKLIKSDLIYWRRELMGKAKKYLDLLVFMILVLFFLSSYFLSLSPLFQVIFVA